MQTPYPLDAEPHSGGGSSGRVRGAEKHEIYAAAFGGHLFYDLFLQGQGGHGPLGPPGSATAFPLECRPPLPLECRPPSPWMQTPSPWMHTPHLEADLSPWMQTPWMPPGCRTPPPWVQIPLSRPVDRQTPVKTTFANLVCRR